MGIVHICCHAIRVEEWTDNILKDSSKSLSRIHTQVLGDLFWRLDSIWVTQGPHQTAQDDARMMSTGQIILEY